MMTDIVRDPYGNPLKRDATIDALRAENEKLRAELHTASDMNAVYEGRLQEKEADNERLRVALQDIIADSFSVYAIEVARAALEESK